MVYLLSHPDTRERRRENTQHVGVRRHHEFTVMKLIIQLVSYNIRRRSSLERVTLRVSSHANCLTVAGVSDELLIL